jgi:predicted LPLAT superfamily acyltransferase
LTKKTFVEKYLDEVVLCGRPLRRRDAYQHFLNQGYSKKEADAFAFGYAKPVDAEPFTLDEFEALMREAHGE